MLPLLPRPRTRVLVVDDDSGVRSVCATLLSVLGCDVLEAASGKQALELLVLRAEPCDLVLLDLEMPGMHGSEVLRGLRRARPDVRVAMMSGRPGTELVRFMGQGASAILEKPFRLKVLDRVLKGALRNAGTLSLSLDERGALRIAGASALH
jgi:DNA-binding response OmpR family regulator